jgi:uncharacterized protein (TIGR03000 family)
MKGAVVVYATRLLLASSFVFALQVPSVGCAQMYPYQPNSYSFYGQPEDYGSEPIYQPEDRSMRTTYGSQNNAMRTMYGSQNNVMRTMYGSQDNTAPDGAMYPSSQGRRVGLPQPSGALKLAPPRAAIVQVRVPTRFADVRFDGERTYTEGTTRYFVTPELPDGKTCHYTVSATWKDGGDEAKKERKVEVKTGHTTVVDFTRPAQKKSS